MSMIKKRVRLTKEQATFIDSVAGVCCGMLPEDFMAKASLEVAIRERDRFVAESRKAAAREQEERASSEESPPAPESGESSEIPSEEGK